MELWNEIDLARHGVIEAHAGTGKTYTIVKLVLRILETTVSDTRHGTRLMHLRELLLITFTEKAAGELRKRIREGLEARIARLRSINGNERNLLIDHLENCLNNLHEALIGTIHGVCLRLLQSRPFESGVHFDTEMVDDTEGLETCLREAMRSDWQRSDNRISGMLALLARYGKRVEKKHFTLMVKTAREVLDTGHTALVRPVPPPGDLAALREELERLRRLKDESVSEVRNLAGKLIESLEAARGARLIADNKKEPLYRRLAELRKIRAGYGFEIAILSNPLKIGTSTIFTRTDLKKNPALSYADDCSNRLVSHPYIAASVELETLLQRVLLTLIADAAELLAVRWNAAKRTNGRISFLDMLRRMHDAVRNSPTFAASLRERIHYAIIDEFQDTSPTQWAIFRRLFLEHGGQSASRLYLVGDPKQSIYMFQGADVDSYLDARSAIGHAGGAYYALVENFRSHESIIDGYNAIFTSRTPEGGWFLSGDEHSIAYTAADAVKVCRRGTTADKAPAAPPLQVMALFGSSTRRYGQMAENASRTIRGLFGQTISVPDGPGWKSLTLDYGHFAVIVEKHALAEPFLDAFRRHGIPAVKYKMEGVFTSPMAEALLALFGAILAPVGNPVARLAALLTHFFNRAPETIDPDRDLEPCPDPACRGDALCIAHALQEWTDLAGRNLWARLFDRIEERTGIRERLIRLIDGERHLADLRQLSEYCFEKLYCDRFTLTHLAEHLALYTNKKRAADREVNLHTLETQKSSVKVLTMHAAKGLEFPVVFAATGASKKQLPRGPDCIRWSAGDRPALCEKAPTNITPYLSSRDVAAEINGTSPAGRCLEQARRERRRLLYVALTRAQSLLFVPMHLKEPPPDNDEFKWSGCKLPTPSADDDLTPVLQSLLDSGSCGNAVGLFPDDRPLHDIYGSDVAKEPARTLIVEDCPDPASLDLSMRICRQTSYSRLSRETALPRSLDRSEESDDDNRRETATPSALPGGRQTGDALHAAIEELLGADDAATLTSDDIRLASIVGKYLDRNGILTRIRHAAAPEQSVHQAHAAIATACTCIQRALSASIELPGGGITVIAKLPKTDRLPEMEFLFPAGQHWVHGFMDLVFRTPAPAGCAHPWRYFALDWKSDTLAAYDHAAIDKCMDDRHYTLQSRLYLHALDRFLRHTLRDAYDPECNLGGAVYVFLRGFADSTAASPFRVHEAQPDRDRDFVDELIFRKDGAPHAA